MRKLLWLAPLLWLCAAPVAAGDAAAGRPGGPDRPGIERMLERNADRLHLDAAQQEQIRALAAAGRDQAQPLRDEAHRLHDEMRALLSSDAPDQSAVFAKADEIGRVETELQKQRLRTMLAVRALLKPEQRREMVKIHEEWRAQHPEFEPGRPGWHDRGPHE